MAGISECGAIYEGNGYTDTINYRTRIDRKFRIPKEFQNKYIYDDDHEPEKPKSKMTESHLKDLGPLFRTKLDPAFKVSTFSEIPEIVVSQLDIDQYKDWIDNESVTPALLSKFDNKEEYIDFMTHYLDTHLTIEEDPAVIKVGKTFSIANDEVYEFTTDLLVGKDFGSVIGSIMYSVTFIHFYHLCTKDYPAHMALDEYYNEMPEKVDALAEHFLGENKGVVFGNAIQPGFCPIQYLEELKGFIISFENQLEPKVVTDIDSYKSQLDDIVNLISSTLYKLKRLATPKTFSIKE